MAPQRRLEERGEGDLTTQRDELQKQIDQIMAGMDENIRRPFLLLKDVSAARGELHKAETACKEARRLAQEAADAKK